MTKEEETYVSTLNLLGTVVLDPEEDWHLIYDLGQMRRTAAHSAGPCVDCRDCFWTTPYGGPMDGEHFADLWEHLIKRHRVETWMADTVARNVWAGAAKTLGVAA